MNKRHRVLLCDDQDMVRWIVREFLKLQSDIEVVGEAAEGQAGIGAALELLPDLVLMDVSMPGVNGVEATRQIVTQAPTVKVLAHSCQSNWEIVDQMFTAGARGYLLKQGDGVELVRAIRTVLAGGCFLSPGLMCCTTPVEEES
jgi:DNA-binding NarL/FixJ family response regulator